MAYGINISFAGDVQVRRKIMRVGAYAGDARPAFESIGKYLRYQLTRQFNTQGRHASGGWAPLQPSTVAFKAAAGLDPRILHATGRMRKAFTKLGGEHIELVEPQSLVFGVQTGEGSVGEYAGVHQNPITSPLPRRRPMEFTETARVEIVRRLQRWIVTGKLK